MQLLHFVAAWLFPGAVCGAAAKVARATTAKCHEHDNESSLAFSVEAADSASSISSPSSSSSSSSDGHPSRAPPASPLCFGAGAGGAGRLLRGSRGARAGPSTKHDDAAAASVGPAGKGDVVGRQLRKISRRLRKARNPNKGSPSSPRSAVDDTARERAESVARAISYCKDTLRRGAAPAQPPPSPSLDDWLHDRQEEIIASAAAHCHERTYSQTPPPRPPSPSTASVVAHGDGEESPHHGRDANDKCRGESVKAAKTAASSSPSDLAADELEKPGSFDEMEFRKIFDGDEEMIGRHFITVQI
ncbi:hypothetical protein GQ55_4G036300 [Panicum hallii var. hallii]|uniref:Uncharacterized protein n=1 Tax=Panicum hallii var. hallii TaxID=1504633 RepID=A0A2T7DUX8_9POAL|nr:hypothetical protein GQ55_4G036300 [Panicum hallii var. hallii]